MPVAQKLDSSTAVSVVAFVHKQIKERILSEALGPGDALLQEHLADEFNVSRAPVREALKLLEAEGLIVFRPRRGYVVSALDTAEIEEIFDIRAMLEGRGGYLAATKRTEVDIREVRALLDQLKKMKVRTSEDLALWAHTNRDFHGRMFASSGRNHLCRVTNVLRDTVERYVRVDAAIPGRIKEAMVEHENIFRAFARGNASLCEKLSREHCEHTCSRLVATLRSHGHK
jgi:DNA-binding GntR family transcriptional regulator